MKALVVLGLFVGTPVLAIVIFFWLFAATAPDQSHLDEQVDVVVLSASEHRRASSVSRFGYRIEYSYAYAGETYVDGQFVPLTRWQPGLPLRACLDPDAPARHTLQLRPEVKCGTYIGTEKTAAPRPGGG